MSSRRTDPDPGDSNPWVRRSADAEPEEAEVEHEPPISPWNHPVDPPPSGLQDTLPDGTQPDGHWGTGMGPPSLRRPEPEQKRRMRLPRLLLPIGGAAVLVAVIGAVAMAALGGEDQPTTGQTPTTGPTPAPSTPGQSPAPSTPGPSGSPSTGPTGTSYTPPANAIPVAHGVSVVPAPGWTVFTPEKQGRQLVVKAPDGHRAFFWVRQKERVSAGDYAVAIFEGETVSATGTRASATKHMPCPRDVLVECVSISYSTVLPPDKGSIRMRGEVQAFRRRDGVVTAMDFQARPDYFEKALADARVMLKSVIDSQ